MTQDYFLNRYHRHFAMGDIQPVKPRDAVVVQVPPHNGFGDEIDSLGYVYDLIPKLSLIHI